MTELVAVRSVRPGDVDTEVAARALRRIKDNLASHPGTPDTIELTVEHGESALVIPRQAVTLFAHILGSWPKAGASPSSPRKRNSPPCRWPTCCGFHAHT